MCIKNFIKFLKCVCLQYYDEWDNYSPDGVQNQYGYGMCDQEANYCGKAGTTQRQTVNGQTRAQFLPKLSLNQSLKFPEIFASLKLRHRGWKVKLCTSQVTREFELYNIKYKLVMQCFLVAYCEISHSWLDCFVCIHARLKARVYTERSSKSWDISQYATRNHCITSMDILILHCPVFPCKILSLN